MSDAIETGAEAHTRLTQEAAAMPAGSGIQRDHQDLKDAVWQTQMLLHRSGETHATRTEDCRDDRGDFPE